MNDPDLIQINNQLWMLRLALGLTASIVAVGLCWLGCCTLKLAGALDEILKHMRGEQ